MIHAAQGSGRAEKYEKGKRSISICVSTSNSIVDRNGGWRRGSIMLCMNPVAPFLSSLYLIALFEFIVRLEDCG